MCGITGWIDWKKDVTHYPAIVEAMTETMAPRGPDAEGIWLSTHCAFGHRRLSVIDPEGGAQPMHRSEGSGTFTIVYNGEIYNARELRAELRCRGYRFKTTCDTEVVLISYIEWGAASVEKLNGIFAYAIWSDHDQQLFMARDRFGVKPLFYTTSHEMLLFGSEPKAILAHPSFSPEIDAEGLAEILALGPARTPGHGIYRNLHELKPGHTLTYRREGLRTNVYWKLESAPHPDDLKRTADIVHGLLEDTVERQMISDVPIGTLLSGGLDSSALTALAVQTMQTQGTPSLHTFSVDYIDNDKHFKASEFQPNSDAPWIQRMTQHLGTQHHPIHFDTPDLVEALEAVVEARDLPGMADIDGSLLLFCREIKKEITVAISGEAADEVFGGYPWFHRKDALQSNTFPWSLQLHRRVSLLSEACVQALQPEQYVADRYQQAIAEVPHLPGENEEQRRRREMSYLNITRFMPTLLDRKDRMSMAVGLEVRVPFCDHRLIQYVWNIPWEMKSCDQREKGILRKALTDVLPSDVLNRKKSPYPKTHNPNYLESVRTRMLELLDDPSSPILPLINVQQIRDLATNAKVHMDMPWFGQLMNIPQLFAYLYQVDYWLRKYRVRIVM